MKDVAMFFLVCVWFAIGITGVVILVRDGHPWFAFFVLVATCSIRYSTSDTPKAQP